MADLFRVKSPDHFHRKICCCFKVGLRAEIIMGMDIPARDAENQNRNRLMGQMDFTCIGTSAASYRILTLDSVFVSNLMCIGHKCVICRRKK